VALVASASLPWTAVSADDAPAAAAPLHPFAPWIDEVEPGTPIRVQGLTVVPLTRAEALQPPPTDLHVGLRGATVSWLDLPAPGGDLYLRLENDGDAPLELTVGEALLTPGGPSRIVTRPAWVKPGAATLVSVAQAALPAPTGPYLVRGLGLSPREQELLDTDRWGAELERRNDAYAVDPLRRADATAAYLTDGYALLAVPYHVPLAALDAPSVVGLMAFDERGACYARVYGSAVPFRQHLAQLVPGLVLDAAEAVRAGRAPLPFSDASLRDQARTLLRRLGTPGVARASFGGCALHRWLVLDRGGRWEGLSVAGEPVSLTWRHRPPPPPPAPPPAPVPPTPPPPQPPRDPPATPTQVGRDPRPTIEDERRADARANAPGAPSGGAPAPAPAPAPGGSGGGLGGGTGGGGTGGGGSGGGGLGGLR
jgi:hypothetical protein